MNNTEKRWRTFFVKLVKINSEEEWQEVFLEVASQPGYFDSEDALQDIETFQETLNKLRGLI